MKKIILSLITIVMSFITFTSVKAIEKPEITNHEKVTIYIFRGNGCGHCANAVNYFNNLGNEYDDYFNVVTYETWYNENNNNLGKKVAEKFDYEFDGVPFIVVGEKHVGGFGSSTGDTLVEYALESYQDKNYKDVVKETLDEIDYEVNETSIKEALNEEGKTNENTNQNTTGDTYGNTSSSGKYDGIIIVGLFILLIGGMAGLVIVGRK